LSSELAKRVGPRLRFPYPLPAVNDVLRNRNVCSVGPRGDDAMQLSSDVGLGKTALEEADKAEFGKLFAVLADATALSDAEAQNRFRRGFNALNNTFDLVGKMMNEPAGK